MFTEAENRVVRAQIKGLVPAIRLAVHKGGYCTPQVGEALNALRTKIIYGGFSGDDCLFVSKVTPEIEFDSNGWVRSQEAMRLVCQLAELVDLSCDGFFPDASREKPEDSDD